MKFRKKPVIIEAVQYTNGNNDECGKFCKNFFMGKTLSGDIRPYIKTLEGDMWVSEGDWIIRGVQGEFYPCKPDIFDMTYEQCVEEL